MRTFSHHLATFLLGSRRLGLWAAVLSLCAFALPLAAQQRSASEQRSVVTQPVDESRRVVLHGSVHPLATRVADRGPVDPALPASRMYVVLKRSPEREAALRAAIEALHDRNSPSFHKWMTPAQFGAQWGASDADIAAVTAWLQSHGFKVAGATAGRTLIEFSGTAGQISEAFHTTIHSYLVNGVLHHANAANPQIPEALAPVIAGISALNDFHPRPQMRKGPRGVYNAATHRVEPDANSASRTGGVRPQLTASGQFGDFLYVGPADAATIYNSPIPALNPAATGATIDGSGAVIGVIGDSSISTTQLANYRTLFGLAPNPITVVLDGSTDPGENNDAVEAYLDTELANGIAPGAQLYYYVAADTNVNYGVDLASVRAVNDNLVDVLSLSFGECEAYLGADNAFYAGLWEQATAQGISVTVSSGDSGSAGCDDANTQTEAYYGLQVNGLASTPYDLAVGGTDFAALAGPDGSGADFTNYVSETTAPTTLRSALGPIPETPWNDAIASFPPTTITASIPYTVPYANIVAAGGGKSGCLSGATTDSGFICVGSYDKPGWQSAPGVPLDGVRDVPDVSLFAANGLDYASWGICTDQDADEAGHPIEDCTLGSDGLPSNQFYIYGVGGTSAAAPAMAGVLALVRQQTGQRQGLANYTLYSLASTTPAIFRDVTAGNNSVPCASGSSDCETNGEGADLLTGYDAGNGYDLASGLGSFDISALLANWTSVGLASSTTQLTLVPTSIEHGQTVDATVTVT
ncbi:MAG TPA: S53 family peptidase, partial [Acidobacteriaceae bacterium]|nr:S53 family peptidase [Acidobacteriaceae bacterium]